MKKRFFKRDEGSLTYTEFGLISVLLSIAATFFLTDMGHNVIETYQDVSTEAPREL